jgi:4-amino-4-deoxy-L-arabinose transferase-like glycosyltransferase
VTSDALELSSPATLRDRPAAAADECERAAPPSRRRMSPALAVIVIALIAIAGTIEMVLATRWGIGLTTDSIRYIDHARDLLAGRGLRGLTHFPPLYPVTIAAVTKLGFGDAGVAARWLQVSLFPVNIALIGWLTHRATGRCAACACAAALLVGVAPVTVGIHCTALSEPLFLTLVLLSLASMSAYVERQRFWLLCAAALTAALAVLTRYAGLALLPVLLGAVTFLHRGVPWRRRIWDVAVLVLLFGVPLGMWLVRNKLLGTATNRSLAFHPIGAQHIEEALETMTTWLFPRVIPAGLRSLLLGFLAGAAAVAGAGAAAARRRRRRRHDHDDAAGAEHVAPVPADDTGRTLRSILLLFAISYVALLVLSVSFVDFYTPLDNRILSPLYAAVLIVGLESLRRFLASPDLSTLARRATIACAVVLVLLQAARGADLVTVAYRDGIGFARRTWQQSKMLARVRTFPPGTVIYSNGADVIEMLTDHRANGLPARYDATTKIANPNYLTDRQKIRSELVASRGVLVYFRRIQRAHHPTEAELRQKLHLRLVTENAEGAIYRPAPRNVPIAK